ncbi:MAG: hypothetical protein AB7S80_08220 [Rhizobiaceae bacterium]
MKLTAATLAMLLAASPALAAWEKAEGGSMVKPTQTNSNIEALFVHCLEGPAIDLYATDNAPVLPAEGGGDADYFYKPGVIRADVDGKQFPLVAAGSDIAVVLFSEGTAEESYLAPIDFALIDAMFAGRTLTIALDITPANGKDGSPFETFASFDLTGAGPLINDAIAPCS